MHVFLLSRAGLKKSEMEQEKQERKANKSSRHLKAIIEFKGIFSSQFLNLFAYKTSEKQ